MTRRPDPAPRSRSRLAPARLTALARHACSLLPLCVLAQASLQTVRRRHGVGRGAERLLETGARRPRAAAALGRRARVARRRGAARDAEPHADPRLGPLASRRTPAPATLTRSGRCGDRRGGAGPDRGLQLLRRRRHHHQRAHGRRAAARRSGGADRSSRGAHRVTRPTRLPHARGAPPSPSPASAPTTAIAPTADPCTTGSGSLSNALNRNGRALRSEISVSVLAAARRTVTFSCSHMALHNAGTAALPTAPRLSANVRRRSPRLSPSPATIRSIA